MTDIFVVTFPFFALVLAGYAATTGRLLPVEAIPGLNVFVLSFALPCMLYRFASTTPIVRLLDPSIVLTYLVAAAAMVAALIAVIRQRARRRDGAMAWADASFGALVGVFPNSGFMGVPLLVALLGSAAAAPAIVALSIDMVFTSSLCVALSQLGMAGQAGEHGARRAAVQGFKGMLKNPLPWAIFLGCLATALQWTLPKPLLRGIEMLGDAASPTALFTIGALLARSRLDAAGRGSDRPASSAGAGVAALVATKLLIHPAAVLGIGAAAIALGAPLERFSLVVLVLIAALPSANNVPMLAERYGADAGRIAQVVLWTTVAAFVSFPLAVGLLR